MDNINRLQKGIITVTLIEEVNYSSNTHTHTHTHTHTFNRDCQYVLKCNILIYHSMICKRFLINASKGSYIHKQQNQGQAQRMELLSDYSML